jgi:hypothetical protein
LVHLSFTLIGQSTYTYAKPCLPVAYGIMGITAIIRAILLVGLYLIIREQIKN